MEWRADIPLARSGDASAVERLREYLTPFAHGVALAHAPHHLVEGLTPRLLDYVLGSLGRIEDAGVASHLFTAARKLAKEAAGVRIDERASQTPAVTEARQTLIRLRALPESAREHLILRWVEGIPGPELAEVLGLSVAELRGELERSSEATARLLAQPTTFTGDDYLWDLSGSPPPLLAKLEMQLPVLRFGASAGTGNSAAKLTGIELKAPELNDSTAVGVEVTTDPGEHKTATEVPVANPFEVQARTIAATDLPAEARAHLPPPVHLGDEPPAPRPVPQVSGSERSGRSNSGRRAAEGARSGAFSAMPPPVEVTRDAGTPLLENDATMAKVPARIALQFEPTSPEGAVLGDDAKGGETRVMPVPPPAALAQLEVGGAPALGDEREDPTRLRPLPLVSASPALPGWFDGATWKGLTPIIIGCVLATLAIVASAATLFADDRRVRANWQLARVVVAAEDLLVGDAITTDNVALRAVSDPFLGSGVVKAESIDEIIGQRVTVAIQVGDPLFFSQFLSSRIANERLARRVMKRLRGFTIETSELSSVGRWVEPGDVVDVVVMFKMPGETGRHRAVTLMQQVRVLATGKLVETLPAALVENGEHVYGNVTLLLSPEEAESLTLAAGLGKVTLTLRNEGDWENDRGLDKAFTDSTTLLNGERNLVVQKKRYALIETIRQQVKPSERK